MTAVVPPRPVVDHGAAAAQVSVPLIVVDIQRAELHDELAQRLRVHHGVTCKPGPRQRVLYRVAQKKNLAMLQQLSQTLIFLFHIFRV